MRKDLVLSALLGVIHDEHNISKYCRQYPCTSQTDLKMHVTGRNDQGVYLRTTCFGRSAQPSSGLQQNDEQHKMEHKHAQLIQYNSIMQKSDKSGWMANYYTKIPNSAPRRIRVRESEMVTPAGLVTSSGLCGSAGRSKGQFRCSG